MMAEHRIALVTGSGRGLGRAFVEALLAEGAAKVYASDKNVGSAAALARALGDRVHAVELDVTRPDQIARAAETCGDVDLLINNAGVASWSGFLGAPSLDGAREEMAVNYFGSVEMCGAFAPALSANGGGAIVNVLSVFALTCFQPLASECASKAAALIMTQGVRAELAGKGVRVLSVFPGAMDTDMTRHIPDPKQDPIEVARATLAALADPDGPDEVFPNEDVRAIAAEVAADRNAAERKYASFGLA